MFSSSSRHIQIPRFLWLGLTTLCMYTFWGSAIFEGNISPSTPASAAVMLDETDSEAKVETESHSDEAHAHEDHAHTDEHAHDEHEHEGESHEEHAAHGEAHGHDDHGSGHADPVTPILLAIIIVLFSAKVGGDVFERVGMPAVLGELVVGVLIGNCLLLTGWDGLEFLKPVHNPDSIGAGEVIDMLARIGVLLLLFEVGMESSVKQMMSVGVSSLLVALLGVIAPMGLGWGAAALIIPEQGWQVHMFLGATLCATSVGITARVLKDLGKSDLRESRIILGAAVIDDVLGLIVLAVASGVIQTGSVDPAAIGTIVVQAFGFLIAAILIGNYVITRPLFKFFSILNGHGLLVVSALLICFFFSWASNFLGLAPIVGAFAAGLILEKVHYRELNEREHHELEEAIHPLSAVLVPIFFVQMGLMVDLSSFSESSVWLLAGALTVVAIIGKQVCAFGVTEKGLNKMAVGLGMIPRGEVGLIFANIGLGLKTPDGVSIISSNTYSAVVVMVMITTMVTPPLLQWALSKDAEPSTDENVAPAEAAH